MTTSMLTIWYSNPQRPKYLGQNINRLSQKIFSTFVKIIKSIVLMAIYFFRYSFGYLSMFLFTTSMIAVVLDREGLNCILFCGSFNAVQCSAVQCKESG